MRLSIPAIRKLAEKKGIKVVGRLTRHPEWEEYSDERWYMDEAGNEYLVCNDLTIITADGGVI